MTGIHIGSWAFHKMFAPSLVTIITIAITSVWSNDTNSVTKLLKYFAVMFTGYLREMNLIMTLEDRESCDI